ncbi:MAG: ankyrin repeat domain-containing protein [Alphaproteobacteria bacterium]|nr:MAG: ankyrin repeat domain-containing protein [Alphaproteobacteria bacterium]
MFPGFLSALLNLSQWILWVACVLLILPVLLNVPGKATPWELALYFALLGAVATYAMLLPGLALGERGARLAGNTAVADALRWCRRGLFVVVLAILGTFFGIMVAKDASRPTLSRQEYFSNSYSNAIGREDTGWLQRLLDEGADVDQRLSSDYTPAALAARFSSWPLVLFLLQRGADPDLASVDGNSVRSLAAEGRLLPSDPQSAAALAEVRALLAP